MDVSGRIHKLRLLKKEKQEPFIASKEVAVAPFCPSTDPTGEFSDIPFIVT
jgi:hypothetical protein